MPYFFDLQRVEELNNDESLARNKLLAIDLIKNFKEIHDPQTHPAHRFLNVKAATDTDFPDLHFRLETNIDKSNILISFWQHSISFELSSQSPNILFQSLRRYAEKIIAHGFLIEDPYSDILLNLDEGLTANVNGYLNWCGMYERVIDLLDNK